MVSVEDTALTARQLEVLELREQGYTQAAVAERLGTTDSNVSAIERAAEANVEKARETLERGRVVRSPVRFTVEPGTSFDEVVDEIYRRGDEAGTKVDYCRPELYAHLYGLLEDDIEDNETGRPLELGLSRDGEVKVFAGAGP
jgi:Tfx family DNA-binding protein